MRPVCALVVAAGRGSRFGADRPKQYLPLGGQPVLRHAVSAFTRHPRIDGVQVVIRPEDRGLYETAVAGLALPLPAPGGATRQDSVRLGLEALCTQQPRHVLIHDGARPFPDPALIDRVLDGLEHAPATIPCIALRDTIKSVEGRRVRATVDRSRLWRAQTPQGFRFDAILAAHRTLAGRDLSDDSAVAETAGLAPALVEGDENNLKITTAEDLIAAERRLAAGLGDVRVGQGFDAHAFGPGDRVVICGVEIRHEAGLIGHSDADVGLHALTDAVLGAIGAGDIGQHFPPSDPQWRGAASDRFLYHAAELVRAQGGIIVHVDVTIICERPKIGPYRTAMVGRIASILGIAAGRVSVKATTTDRLGFTGRSEGAAAQAVATVRLPL